MPYRTFFCYANSTQEAEEWIKMLQWKLVCSDSYCWGIPWEQLSYKMGRGFFVLAQIALLHLQQSRIFLNLRTGPTGHATLFNQ